MSSSLMAEQLNVLYEFLTSFCSADAQRNEIILHMLQIILKLTEQIHTSWLTAMVDFRVPCITMQSAYSH